MRTTSICKSALVGTAFAVAAVWSAPPAPAQTPSSSDAAAVQVAAKKKLKRLHRRVRYDRHGYDGGHIACFPDGCRRVPPGCVPTTAYDTRGNPTGFDTVICR
jgi:hypothetical protein